jgi:L-asparaginase II
MGVTGPSAAAARLRIEVEVWRGSIPESRHRIQAAVVDAAGTPIVTTEHADVVTSFRSSAKPFQLLPLIERGQDERWGFTDEHLAVMAGSHTGSPYHLALVRQILERLGLGENALACGYHDPLDPESLDQVQTHPERRTALYNNCSGKHAGMLAQALAEGWPIDGYERADHPLQRRLRETVAALCGVAPEALLVGVDGCSVSVFGAPLWTFAYAYAKFAAARPEGDARERALDRIRRAMIRYPAATGGGRRFSTQLMEAAGGTLVAKGGAEGLECVGVPDRGLGIALKCEDGRSRGVGPAVVTLLEHLGLLTPEQVERLDPWRRPAVRNAAGLVVGEVRARVESLDAVPS